MESVIKILREQNRYTQVALAEKLGISRQALIKYENMEIEPSLAVIRSLSKLFLVSYECLIDNTIPESPDFKEQKQTSELVKNFLKLSNSEKHAVLEMARIMANN